MTAWAAIFDWDGVIIDSSRQHLESWQLLAAEERRPLPQDFFLRSFGMKGDSIVREFLRWTDDPHEAWRLVLRKEELYRELLRRHRIRPLPGAVEWLRRLKTSNVACAVGSSTPRENILCAMEMGGLGKFFRAIVAGEDVARGKPHPDVFLLAAEKLNAPPGRCVVFEDAPVGIEAARAAGMKVVGVATTHSPQTLRKADRVVHRLDELAVEEISRWF